MTVSVATCSAKQLLSNSLRTDIPPTAKDAIVASDGAVVTGKLTIPEYQRPYCWQDLQLETLLQHIQAHFSNGPSATGIPYYLGSIILHKDGDELKVIDGQQRITTLALIACLLETVDTSVKGFAGALSFDHPTSQQQIKHNLYWLKQRFEQDSATWSRRLDFNRMQFTLVITRSEDDAYLFFETQNTGGVRLGGPDIIKAHHLRAVEKAMQASFARRWESMGKLDDVIAALLKGRYWQKLGFRPLPSHRQAKQIKECIVAELGNETGHGYDLAFGRVCRQSGLAGDITQTSAQQGYEVRQPLNAGINTIRYLSYFQGIYQAYWQQPDLPHQKEYQDFIEWLKQLPGCSYLEDLYVACLTLYISQFGEQRLESVAQKLFRVVYSKRVSNQKAVRENSIPDFVKNHPVLDWVALSYTPEQCVAYLDGFELEVDGSNLDKESIKKRYMDKVNERFALNLKSGQYAESFAAALTRKIGGEGA